jgi:tetratricopeptide (TPR) repeat protein
MGVYRDRSERAEPAIKYFERARLAFPTHPIIWYTCGEERFSKGNFDEAWSDWRQCLTLSPIYLQQILSKAITRLNETEILEKVLPDEPTIIEQSAVLLFPEPAEKPESYRSFHEKALSLLQANPARTEPADEHLLGKILRRVGRNEEAITHLQRALDRDQSKNEWRYELAEALYDQERFEDAMLEVRTILMRQSTHRKARELRDVLDRELKLLER